MPQASREAVFGVFYKYPKFQTTAMPFSVERDKGALRSQGWCSFGGHANQHWNFTRHSIKLITKAPPAFTNPGPDKALHF